jgi:septal ring-binding cell division protein DamX
MYPSRLRDLTLLCWVSATFPVASVSAAAVDILSLFPRDTLTCPGSSNLLQCGQGLPSNFCCPPSSTCLSLNNTGTQAALCCPSGSDCSFIQPVSCDTTLQNPSIFPNSSLHIGDPTASLKLCGTQCCPLGYECQSNVCAMLNSTKAAPTTTASNSKTATATSTASSTSTATGTSSPASVEPVRTASNKFSAGAVLAGLFPGILIGLLIAAAVYFFLKKRRQRKQNDSDRESHLFGGPAPRQKISEPIYQPGMSDRTDFMHARTASGNSIPQSQIPSSQQANVGFGGYYRPQQQSDRPITGSTGTLVSPTQQEHNQNTSKLGAPFETPTRPAKPVQGGRVRALFSKSPSQRSKQSRQTLGQSTGSLETIDVLMREQPGLGLPPPTLPPFQYTPDNGSKERPETPQTTYADVYRAAGLSPPKSEFGGGTNARPSIDSRRF